MKILRYFLLGLHLLILVPTLLALLSPVVSPSYFYWPALCALILPFLLLTQMVFLVYWLVRWDWPALLSLFALVIAIPAINRMVQLGYSSRVQDERSFQLMSYNAHDLRELQENENLSPKRVREMWQQFTRSMDELDIIAFQEYGYRSKIFFEEIEKFPYSVNCDKSEDIRISSKFPIIDFGCIDLVEDGKNQALWADIHLPKGKSLNEAGDTIRIYSFHLASNQISQISTEMALNPKLNPEYLYTNARMMFSRYKFHAPTRLRELNLVLNHTLTTTYPIILCGDYNETPQSHLYKLIAENYSDTFVRRGRGMGDTYAGSLPFLRIDYIFVSDAFKTISYKVGKEIEFSDHYPVVASLKLEVD